MKKKTFYILLFAVVLLIAVDLMLPVRQKPESVQYFDFLKRIDEAAIFPELPVHEHINKTAAFEKIILSDNFEQKSERPWRLRISEGKARANRTSQSAYSGKYSYKIWDIDEGNGDEGAEAEIFHAFKIQGKTRYRFTAYIRRKNIRPQQASMAGVFYLSEYKSRNGKKDEHAQNYSALKHHRDFEETATDKDDWKKIEYVFTTLQETTFIKIACCLGRGGRAAGQVFIDDISLAGIREPGAFVYEKAVQIDDYKINNVLRRAAAVPVPCNIGYQLVMPDESFLDFAFAAPEAVFAVDQEKRKTLFEVKIKTENGRIVTLMQETAEPGGDWTLKRLPLSGFEGKRASILFSTNSIEEQTGEPKNISHAAGLWAHPVFFDAESDVNARPSVIWISIDTLRADHLGSLGYPRAVSPNIDRLAASGILFSQAESSSPWTLPSHASMLTALFPGLHQADDKIGLVDQIPTAAQIFSDNGYLSGAFTTHLYVSETFGFDRGFDVFASEQDVKAGKVVEQGLRFIEKNKNRPLFLFLHMFDPHWDYEPPAPYDKLFDPEYQGTITGGYRNSVLKYKYKKNEPDPDDLNRIISLYDGEIRYCDAQIGRLIQSLKKEDMLSDMIVVVTSDHGEEFRDHDSMGHGTTLYQEQLHVPLIFFGKPLGIDEPKVIDIPVRTVDILPTLLDSVEIEYEPKFPLSGAELTPLFRKQNISFLLNYPCPAETSRFNRNLKSLRSGEEKMIRSFKRDTVHYYDLGNDPAEQTDLAEQNQERLKILKSELNHLTHMMTVIRTKYINEETAIVELSDSETDLLRSLGYVE